VCLVDRLQTLTQRADPVESSRLRVRVDRLCGRSSQWGRDRRHTPVVVERLDPVAILADPVGLDARLVDVVAVADGGRVRERGREVDVYLRPRVSRVEPLEVR